MQRYTLIDEPRFSSLPAVSPIIPLLSSILTGILGSWILFIVNSFALDKVTFKKNVKLVMIGLIGNIFIIFAMIKIDQNIEIEKKEIIFHYLPLILTTWKLFISYRLFYSQDDIYQIRISFQETQESIFSKNTLAILLGIHILHNILFKNLFNFPPLIMLFS